MANSISAQKKNGVFYTPSILARNLIEPLIQHNSLKILDPSFGEGSLLLTAEQIAREKFPHESKQHLYGCDINPSFTKAGHLSESVVRCDFFDYPISKKFDLILMNPPFVRHHLLEKEKIAHYQNTTSSCLDLKGSSDLWAYFLVKSSMHLSTGGSIGAILPWSFLQAEYSVSIRKWLINKFESIKVLALGSSLFQDAQERIILLWLQGFKKQTNKIRIGFSNNLFDFTEYVDLGQDGFTKNKVCLSINNDSEGLISIYKNKYGFRDFSDVADVSIGVVTGADDFFIKKNGGTCGVCLDSTSSVPIFTKCEQIKGLIVDSYPCQYLLCIDESNSRAFSGIIAEGEKHLYHERAHSIRRKPWYKVKIGKIPDAFFHYRASRVPYLVLNKINAQCTNSIHRVYFKKLTSTEVKWLQVSLLSIPGQVSIEINSRSYGGGVLKIEPGSLKKAICYLSNDRSISRVHQKISKLLLINDKIGAMQLATSFLNQSIGIDDITSARTVCIYKDLITKRLKEKGSNIIALI